MPEVESYRNNFRLALVSPAVGKDQVSGIPKIYYEKALRRAGFVEFLNAPENQVLLSQTYSVLREDYECSQDFAYYTGLKRAHDVMEEIEKWDRGESERVYRPELSPSEEKYLEMEHNGVAVPELEELAKRQNDIQTRLNPLLEQVDQRMQMAGIDTSDMEV